MFPHKLGVCCIDLEFFFSFNFFPIDYFTSPISKKMSCNFIFFIQQPGTDGVSCKESVAMGTGWGGVS